MKPKSKIPEGQLALFNTADYKKPLHWSEWEFVMEKAAKSSGMLEPDNLKNSSIPEQEPAPIEQSSSGMLEADDNVTSSIPEQILGEKPALDACHWIEIYSPAGKRHLYYRYVWKEGQRLRHTHLKGGNIKAARAIALKESVESAIALGKSPHEIKGLIQKSERSARYLPPF